MVFIPHRHFKVSLLHKLKQFAIQKKQKQATFLLGNIILLIRLYAKFEKSYALRENIYI